MKVILKQDVKGLGKKGDSVEVAEGYGRNFLIPRGLALPASEGALRAVENLQKAQEAKAERLLKAAQALKQKLEGTAVTVKVRAGEGGKLFGSVTNKDVAAALNAKAGTKVDRKQVELDEHIKSLGTYQVTVRLAPEIAAKVNVQVQEA